MTSKPIPHAHGLPPASNYSICSMAPGNFTQGLMGVNLQMDKVTSYTLWLTIVATRARRSFTVTTHVQPKIRPCTTSILGSEWIESLAMAQETPFLRSTFQEATQPEFPDGQT
ncbi:MAG: hypothetical protein Q9171_002338 [Xanthocarpia ochracea]